MIKLTSIKLNDGSHGLPKNPRLIKDDRFKSLCESVKNNPEYMPARPIVVDENSVILGGNMRWRACRELGMKEIPAAWVKRVEGWSLEKKRRFIILDNRGWVLPADYYADEPLRISRELNAHGIREFRYGTAVAYGTYGIDAKTGAELYYVLIHAPTQDDFDAVAAALDGNVPREIEA